MDLHHIYNIDDRIANHYPWCSKFDIHCYTKGTQTSAASRGQPHCAFDIKLRILSVALQHHDLEVTSTHSGIMDSMMSQISAGIAVKNVPVRFFSGYSCDSVSTCGSWCRTYNGT